MSPDFPDIYTVAPTKEEARKDFLQLIDKTQKAQYTSSEQRRSHHGHSTKHRKNRK